MPRNRRSKQERSERRHARAEKAARRTKKAARATVKGLVFTFAMALIPGIGATIGTYAINKSAKKAELMIEARGIARVAERDLKDAAIALTAYKKNKHLPKDFWTRIEANDLQVLASNLKSAEWRRFGCAVKTADVLLTRLDSGSRPARRPLGKAIYTIRHGAAALHEVTGDPGMFKGFKRVAKKAAHAV